MKLNAPKGKLHLALMAALATGAAHAEQVQELATTVVKAENESSVSHTIKKVSADDISKKSLSNIEDTTRYIPGVQVNDAGNRFGDNGFNIRGLQGDAVAVTVDGVSLGETLAPANFSAYGMYDSTRGQVELEHVKEITITKGPSSVANGANALAGSVAYTTNDATDFLEAEGNDTTFRLKTGYDSRNSETLLHGTFANRTGKLESLVQITVRDGNEFEAHGDGKAVTSVGAVGASGLYTFTSLASETEVADPFDIESQAILAKAAYNLTDDIEFGVVFDMVDRTSEGKPLSRQLEYPVGAPLRGFKASYYNFNTDDTNDKMRYGLFANLNNAQHVAFDSVSATLDVQELKTSGVTSFNYHTNFTASADGILLRREDRSTEQNMTTFAIDFQKFVEGDISHKVAYGLQFEQREIENVLWDRRFAGLTDSAEALEPTRDPSWVPVTDTDVLSLYISDTMQLTDQFTLTAGLRYDSTEYSPKVDDTFQDASGVSVLDSEFSATAGELVAEYEFMPNNYFLASYTQGYRAPSAQDLYLDTNNTTATVTADSGTVYQDLETIANPDLDAEESSSIEFGYKLETERASVTITAYQTKYENRIQRVSYFTPFNNGDIYTPAPSRFNPNPQPVTGDTYYQKQNVGEVDVQGVEVDASYAFTDNLYSRFTFTTIDGEYKDNLENFHRKGDDLETAGPDSGTLTFGYQADGDTWGIALHTLWFDEVKESTDLSYTSLNNGSGPVHYPSSYTVLDLTAFYEISDDLRVTAAAYNLTDKEYYRWEVLNSIRPGSGGFFGGATGDGYKRYSEPGRSFSVNLTYSF